MDELDRSIEDPPSGALVDGRRGRVGPGYVLSLFLWLFRSSRRCANEKAHLILLISDTEKPTLVLA